MSVTEIVSDRELEKAFANANFGSMAHRDVLRYAVLKCACGYYQGFTSKTIATELGLITWKGNVTAKGRKYMWDAFADGTHF